MNKNLKTIICATLLLLSGSTIANANTDSSYSIYYARGQQNAALTVYSTSAACGTYQNFNGGSVYTLCSSNYGYSKESAGARNAGFMINGTSFSTYHKMNGGGYTNVCTR